MKNWNLALKVHTCVYIHIKKKKKRILAEDLYIHNAMANRISQYNNLYEHHIFNLFMYN